MSTTLVILLLICNLFFMWVVLSTQSTNFNRDEMKRMYETICYAFDDMRNRIDKANWRLEKVMEFIDGRAPLFPEMDEDDPCFIPRVPGAVEKIDGIKESLEKIHDELKWLGVRQ